MWNKTKQNKYGETFNLSEVIFNLISLGTYNAKPHMAVILVQLKWALFESGGEKAVSHETG